MGLSSESKRFREVMPTDRVRLGMSPVCEREGHDIDLVLGYERGIGICRRCPGVFIDLRKLTEKEDEKARAKYGCAEGDIIEARGETLRVFLIRDYDIICKRMDENGEDIPGDDGETRINHGEFCLVKTRAQWWRERNQREGMNDGGSLLEG